MKVNRSESKSPLWLVPQEWLREMAKAFNKGWPKYGLGNCYKAINTGHLDSIREFFNHSNEHLASFISTLANGKDDEGMGPVDHLGAAMWNIGMLITYTIKNPEAVKRAFDCNSLKKGRD